MKLLEVSSVALDPSVEKKAKRALNNVKFHLKQYGKAEYSIKPLGPFKAELIVEYQKVLDPVSIRHASSMFYDAIEDSDKEGHIFKIDDGDGHSENFVEALLAGLKPGMVVKAEAFFPYLAYEVTWKQIVKK